MQRDDGRCEVFDSRMADVVSQRLSVSARMLTAELDICQQLSNLTRLSTKTAQQAGGQDDISSLSAATTLRPVPPLRYLADVATHEQSSRVRRALAHALLASLTNRPSCSRGTKERPADARRLAHPVRHHSPGLRTSLARCCALAIFS